MSTQRKDLRLNIAQRELVNFSVKAQDQILKQGLQPGGGFKTTDDLFSLSAKFNNNSVSVGPHGTNATTNISYDDPSRHQQHLNKSQFQELGDQLLLPSISTVRKGGQQSPFKGFIDISTVTQKMRQTAIGSKQVNAFDISNKKDGKQLHGDTLGAIFKMDVSLNKDRASSKMNPKVLETWINETLQDAEHLDIPGVILKPEHKNPISRYGIDRLVLTNAGIPNEMVDRIFRALFVYSVGFYELIKKCLQHSEKKYSIITSIWKVFSILLEYCCKTDYRMLISEISKEHKDELDKLEKEFQTKFQEQAFNEKILKQNMEILQKYNEELEKERTNERQMRLKLEEEYMQNTKNHEEEVQLRLKFESKLNNMHSVHRDLETKHKRALNELASLQNTNEQLTTRLSNNVDEITELKTLKAENESKINYNEEKLNALQREINIKIRQVEDYEQRYAKTQDELDLTKYKLQESMKDVTELRLKIDVHESSIEGYKNEKTHLELELKETKDLQKIYETKCGKLMQEINKVNLEFQESKREIIGFGEIQKEREERIDKLKKDFRELKIQFDEVDLKHGTLTIQHEKVSEQYENSKKDLDDAIDKLHITNKIRHETEVKLHEEMEKNRNLVEIIKDKDETLAKRATELDELDRKTIELERSNEALEIKKAGIERSYELTKKQLNEKISNLNDVLSSEKETREMWIERYEKEQRDHTTTNAQLLQIKSTLKDQVLSTKNGEIKLSTQIKANEVLSDSNIRLQDNLNEALAKCENVERELNTQKEIMKQMDSAKKDYIVKLKRELDNVESRFYFLIDQVSMTGEDYQSRARENYVELVLLTAKHKDALQELAEVKDTLTQKLKRIQDLEQYVSRLELNVEDYNTSFTYLYEDKQKILSTLSLLRMKLEDLEQTNNNLRVEADQKLKYQSDYNDALKSINQLKKENSKYQSKQSVPTVDKTDAQVQTVIIGQNLESLINATVNNSFDSGGTSSNQNIGGSQQQLVNKPTGMRVGGGGEIRKVIRSDKRQPANNNQSQQQQLFIGGQQPPAGTSSQVQSKQSTNSVVGNQSYTNINNLTQGNQPIPQQVNQAQNNNVEQQPKSSLSIGQEQRQQIQNVYPQTTTNNQKKMLPFSNQNLQNQRGFDSQQVSPRDMQSQINDDTMASNGQSKQSPGGFGIGGPIYQQENQTMSSIMQSPQASLNYYNNNNSNNLGTGRLVQQSLQHEQGTDYATIQSQQQNNFNNYYGQNTLDEHDRDNVIFEQQIEEDEERKTDVKSGDQSQSQLRRGYSQESQNKSQLINGNQTHKVVEFKGINSVMKANTASNKIPSKIGQKGVQIFQQVIGSPSNEGNHVQELYEGQNESFNSQQNSRMMNHDQYQYYENQVAREATQQNQQQNNNETLDQNSIESGFNQGPQQQYQNQNRLKVDITNIGGVKNIGGGTYQNANQLGSQSPQSQNSGYSQVMQQANFNQTQTSNNSQTPVGNQIPSSRQVKGKTSIRTLIKSAATRE